MEKVTFWASYTGPEAIYRSKQTPAGLFIFSSSSTFMELELKTVDGETFSSHACTSVVTQFLFDPVSGNE